MKRVCFLLRLKKDRMKDYLEAHQVWPELLAVMREAGLRNYSLFLRRDGLVVGYLEAEDPEAALQQVAATDVSLRWEAEMAPFFAPDGGGTEEWLEEYFHMDGTEEDP